MSTMRIVGFGWLYNLLQRAGGADRVADNISQQLRTEADKVRDGVAKTQRAIDKRDEATASLATEIERAAESLADAAALVERRFTTKG